MHACARAYVYLQFRFKEVDDRRGDQPANPAAIDAKDGDPLPVARRRVRVGDGRSSIARHDIILVNS